MTFCERKVCFSSWNFVNFNPFHSFNFSDQSVALLSTISTNRITLWCQLRTILCHLTPKNFRPFYYAPWWKSRTLNFCSIFKLMLSSDFTLWIWLYINLFSNLSFLRFLTLAFELVRSLGCVVLYREFLLLICAGANKIISSLSSQSLYLRLIDCQH